MLDEYLTALSQNQDFNGTVLVVEKGKPFTRNLLAMLIFQREKNSAASLLNIASISKTFTAVAVLQLKEQYKLELNDPFIKYFPEFPYPEITIKQLLSHTSGLPDNEALFDSLVTKNPEEIFTNADLIPALKLYHGSKELRFKPGEGWGYSNIGYDLLALLIEKVSNTFDVYMKKNVFLPAGMHDSYIQKSLSQKTGKDRCDNYTYNNHYEMKLQQMDSLADWKEFTYNLTGLTGSTNVISNIHDLWAYDSLRSKKWLDKNGHTPSIMDYARFNYVAQPEDQIGVNNIYPHIGDYDRWAIQWGYKWLPDNVTPAAENDTLNKWIVNKLASGRQYYFGSETSNLDPRCQNEDLGDDAMKAGAYGIKNLKRIMPNLLKWTAVPTEGYDQAGIMYAELGNQYIRYMLHIAKNVGGIMATAKSIEQSGPQIEPVAKSKQQEAIRFFSEQLFTTPKWLISEKMYGLTGVSGYSFISRAEYALMNILLSNERINRMIQLQNIYPDTYTVADMLRDLTKSIFSELPAHASIDNYRRDLQRMYVEAITVFLTADAAAKISVGTITITGTSPAANSLNDAKPVIKSNVRTLLAMVKEAINSAPDTMTKEHLLDLKDRLATALKDKTANATE